MNIYSVLKVQVSCSAPRRIVSQAIRRNLHYQSLDRLELVSETAIHALMPTPHRSIVLGLADLSSIATIDVDSRRTFTHPTPHEDMTVALEPLTSDMTRLVTGGVDGRLIVHRWEPSTSTGPSLETITDLKANDWIRCLHGSQGILHAGLIDGTIVSYDAESMKQTGIIDVNQFLPHGGAVATGPSVIRTAADMKGLIVSNRAGHIAVIDARARRASKTVRAHQYSINSIAIDGHIMATAGRDSTVRLWDLRSFHAPTAVLTDHTCTTSLLDVAFDAQHNIITGCERQNYVVYSPSGKVLDSGNHGGGTQVIVPLGPRLAVVSRNTPSVVDLIGPGSVGSGSPSGERSGRPCSPRGDRRHQTDAVSVAYRQLSTQYLAVHSDVILSGFHRYKLKATSGYRDLLERAGDFDASTVEGAGLLTLLRLQQDFLYRMRATTAPSTPVGSPALGRPGVGSGVGWMEARHRRRVRDMCSRWGLASGPEPVDGGGEDDWW